ncbi:MAG: hypothetical protein ACM3O3_06770, partial [Syntrophothermus sp.]
MLEQKKLLELKPGEQIEHFFIVKKCEKKTSKTNTTYYTLELSDNKSSMISQVFNDSPICDTLIPGSIIKVRGCITTYQGNLQIKIDRIRLAIPEDGVEVKDFLRKSEKYLEDMKCEFINRIDKINNQFIKSLLKLVFNEDDFDKFSNMPAGKAWHHSYIHGLLEHTLEIIKICDLLADFHP